MSIIITELEKVIPYDSISLQILNDKSLEILACRGFARPGEIVGMVFPLDPKYPNQRVIEENEPLAIEDVVKEYPHFKSESSKYESGHIRSWLGVPLISKGRVKGMIALDRTEVLPFLDDEIQLATAFAGQAILAIENARLFSAANRRLERLASLRQIDQVIANSLDLRLTFNVLIGKILQHLEVDAAAALLYQPELQNLKFVAGQGFRTQALQSTDLRLGEDFAGQAALEQRIVQVSNLEQLQTAFLRSPDFHIEGFVDYIGVPLVAKGNIIGVLEIYQRSSLDPGPEWMEFLENLAGQAAIAIDNINLFDNLQATNMELAQAYDATIEGWARALELRNMETEGNSRRVVTLTQKLARKLGMDIPYCHHEKWDGTGNPQGLKGDQIPLPARVFAVVDVWDALLSDRPYRKAWGQEKTISYLREQSGKHFDPQVVTAFLELLIEERYFK